MEGLDSGATDFGFGPPQTCLGVYTLGVYWESKSLGPPILDLVDRSPVWGSTLCEATLWGLTARATDFVSGPVLTEDLHSKRYTLGI